MFRYLFALLLLSSCDSAPSSTVHHDQGVRVELVADSLKSIVSDTIKLGRVYSGEVVAGSFRVWNNTDKPVVITNVVMACGCTSAEWDKAPINAGEERLLKFSFDTKSRQGYQLKSIDVVANDYRVARVLIEAEVILN